MTAAFDFRKAAEQARRDYPRETRNISFISGDDPHAADEIGAVMRNMDPEFLAWSYEGRPMDEAVATHVEFVLASGAISFKDPVTGKGGLYVDTSMERLNMAGNPEGQKHFTFNHELAHLVLPLGLPSAFFRELRQLPKEEALMNMKLYATRCENMCDTFAAIKTAAEGNLTPAELGKISLQRAFQAVAGDDTEHLSTLSLDRISLDIEKGKFISLTPAEIAAIAQKHGREFAPSLADGMEVEKMFASTQLSRMIGCNANLAVSLTVCASLADPEAELSPKGDYARYVTARLARRMLSSNSQDVLRHIDNLLGSGSIKKAEAEIARMAHKYTPVDGFIKR